MPGGLVEFRLVNKQSSAQVVVTYTNDKLEDIVGAESLPQNIMAEMQKYLTSISVFRCRCLELCKYCIKPGDEGTTFSRLGVCKHFSGLARNISAGNITIKNNPKGYKEMDNCKIAVAKETFKNF